MNERDPHEKVATAYLILHYGNLVMLDQRHDCEDYTSFTLKVNRPIMKDRKFIGKVDSTKGLGEIVVDRRLHLVVSATPREILNERLEEALKEKEEGK